MKRALIALGVLGLAIIVFVFVADYCRNAALSSQDDFVRSIELPYTIERIAVRSAIGDSGGSGSQITLRSVMLVRTELSKDALAEILFDDNTYVPSFWSIQEAGGYQFNSAREFRLDFEELKGVHVLEGYFFIEFIR